MQLKVASTAASAPWLEELVADASIVTLAELEPEAPVAVLAAELDVEVLTLLARLDVADVASVLELPLGVWVEVDVEEVTETLVEVEEALPDEVSAQPQDTTTTEVDNAYAMRDHELRID